MTKLNLMGVSTEILLSQVESKRVLYSFSCRIIFSVLNYLQRVQTKAYPMSHSCLLFLGRCSPRLSTGTGRDSQSKTAGSSRLWVAVVRVTQLVHE